MPETQHYRSQIAKRTIYAEAMGIDSWVARLDLPSASLVLPVVAGSAVSPALSKPGKAAAPDPQRVTAPELQKAAAPEPQQAAAPATQSRGSSQRDALVSSLGSIGTASENRNKPDSPPPAAEVAPATSIALAELPRAFELYYATFGDLVVVDDISQRNCAMSVYQNWLSALELAFNRKLQASRSGEASSLRWPDALGSMVTSANLAGGDKLDAAREVISAWLSRRLTGSERYLLLMGDVPGLLLGDELLSQLCPGSSSISVLRSASSAELWQSPDSKRLFWQQVAAALASQ